MPEKPGKNREQLKEITDRIEAGIRDIFESGDMDKYRNYLRTMSRFHNYSLNNQALIHLQRPDATLVAGYNRWRDKFSRHVLRGEKGITIIAPTPYKKKIEQEKLDPDTKLPILDADGKVITEEKEIEIPMFRPVKVFDYAQTDGKPLPERVASPVANLTGSVENYEAFMEALRRSSPVPVEFKPLSADMDGYFSPKSQSITLREGMSEVQTVSAAVHEIAHAKLHNYGLQQAAERRHKSRNTEEVEAESISFMVCAYFGIETGANSFGYVATWSKNAELPEFRASLDTISKTANGIITDVEKHFAEVCKERGIELPNLDMIYQRFNVDHPADFKGHSLSVSDIVALKQNGVVSCHYVDSIGFRELPNFLKPENYLKNAEMLLEDDYGMIDGIINNGPKQPTVADLEAQVKAGFSISLTELAAASHREQKKPSVLEKLREKTPEQAKNKTAPKRSAEREL